MDFLSNAGVSSSEPELSQANYLLEIIKEICTEPDCKLSSKLKGKVNRIVSDCELKHHSSLHKVYSANDSTASILGFMGHTTSELTFDEQAELHQVLLQKIETKFPICESELDNLKDTMAKCIQLKKDKMKAIEEREEKLKTLQEQESEKMALMMEWLNHRIHGAATFSDNSSELLELRTKILNLKSKILNLQILHNIFTETSESIQAYSEIHEDFMDSIKATERRIKNFRDIIESDHNQPN